MGLRRDGDRVVGEVSMNVAPVKLTTQAQLKTSPLQILLKILGETGPSVCLSAVRRELRVPQWRC